MHPALAHAQIALIGLGLGFLAVHYLAEPAGSAWALAIGLAICAAWSGLLVLIRTRLTRRASPVAP